MNYSELSLDKLKEIAKEKGLSKSALVTVWIEQNQKGKR